MNKKLFLKISNIIRKDILKITFLKKASHIGSNLSIVEILIVLYKNFIKKKNKNELILSKGHACLSLYCVLSYFKYIPKSLLKKFGNNNSIMMSHVSHKIPGVKISTGSLGHGLPIAAGKAFVSKKKKFFIVLSDGELNEGSNWEALMFIGHHRLTNIKIIIDSNKIQSIGYTKDILNLNPLKKKLQYFGFHVSSINGHDCQKINQNLKKKINKPLILIANTIKGKGVKFMENSILWHYKPPNKKELDLALKKL